MNTTFFIRKDDQRAINTFSILNQKTIRNRQKVKQMKKSLRDLEESINEVEFSVMNADLDDLDDEKETEGSKQDIIPVRVGDVWMSVPSDKVISFLEKKKDKLTSESRELQNQVERDQETMQILKKNLYALFGEAIQLEHEEDEDDI